MYLVNSDLNPSELVKLTPRNKHRAAVYLLQNLYPYSNTGRNWSNRKNLYTRLNQLGWTWQPCGRFGYWSDVCF